MNLEKVQLCMARGSRRSNRPRTMTIVEPPQLQSNWSRPERPLRRSSASWRSESSSARKGTRPYRTNLRPRSLRYRLQRKGCLPAGARLAPARCVDQARGLPRGPRYPRRCPRRQRRGLDPLHRPRAGEERPRVLVRDRMWGHLLSHQSIRPPLAIGPVAAATPPRGRVRLVQSTST